VNRKDDRGEKDMAQKAPETFLAGGKRPATAPAEERLFRLPPDRAKDLRDVARGVEETDAGVCCSYLVDHMSGEGADFDEHALQDAERFAEQSLSFDDLDKVHVVRDWRARLVRARRALRLLHDRGDGRAVAVLHVAHGHPDPITRDHAELLGMREERGVNPLGSLARYTDEVERRRQEMISRELRASLPRRGARYREGGDLRAMAAADGYDPDHVAEMIDLIDARERRERLDRVITSGDALRDALLPFLEPGPSPRWIVVAERADHTEVRRETGAEVASRRAGRDAREAAHRERREAFLSRVRADAARMLSRAEKAYHDAWLASP
jgi:hypothetical protein